MRITRLDLVRYGHVSGECLEFPPEQGLHVVLGANEAGKSTALEAVADGLFGFPGRTRTRANHPDDARVGFTLLGADGATASFVRRRTMRDKLLDDAGTVLPEAALARFLGGTGRERFQEVFGLDGERLRKAGRAIMAEQGEAGAAILSAQTGLRGLRETAEKLEADAKALFGDNRTVRRISLASKAIDENRRLVRDRSVSGPEYVAAQKNEAALLDQSSAIDHERQALRAEQTRLARIRATAPLRRDIADIAARLEALGPASPLPGDAEARSIALRATAEQSGRDHARLVGEIAAIEAKLAALPRDPAVLDEADTITALQAQANTIADKRADHLSVSGEADGSATVIEGLARRLGAAERGEALRARLPDLAMRRTAETLLKQHAADTASASVAAEALARAQHDAAEAAQALAASAEAAEHEGLEAAVEEARAAGSMEAELAKAATARDEAHAEAWRRLSQLALWQGDLVALEATAVPLEAEAARLGAALDASAAACRDAEAALDALDAEAAEHRAGMLGIEAAGTLPTADAIAALRARRDATWHEVRRMAAAVPDGAAPGGLAMPGRLEALTSTFEALLTEADALADARHGALARVQAWERLRTEAARLAARRPAVLATRDAARQAAASARAAWRAAWLPVSGEAAGDQAALPADPASMREWVRDRAAVLSAAATARAAQADHAGRARRVDLLRARLHAVLPDAAGDAPDLATLLRQGTRRLKAQADQAATRDKLRERAAKAETDRVTAQRTHDAAGRRLAEWLEKWAAIAHRLGLPPGADPNVATDLLGAWSEIDKEFTRWDALQTRLRQMRLAIQDYDDARAALARRLDVPLTEALVETLSRRHRAAEAAAADHHRLTQDRDTQAAQATDHARAMQDATAALLSLRQAACVDDDAGLSAAIAAAAERARLLAQRQDREAALRTQSDGKTGPELDEEAAAQDSDAIPGRQDEIATRLTALDTAAAEAAGELVRVRHGLHAMEAGQDVAGPAQAIKDSMAGIEEDTNRYLRLRLAQALLRGGIDAYRRSQQGPLLARASTLFAALTGGRYTRLEQDEGTKGDLFIVAVRPDGSTCPAGSLSEGTTDQLFLALRLASIALDAAATEPMPFIADDLLVNFDDERAAAALRLLANFGRTTQVILFTHHRHLLDLVAPGTASVHRLPREVAG